MKGTRIRVLICKVGLDIHDRGPRALTRMLMEAGMEAVYLGLFQEAEQIIRTAIQEDVDVVGISCMCNEHRVFMPEVARLLYEQTGRSSQGLPLLLVGGVIPRSDFPELERMGADAIFPAGSMVNEIVWYIETEVSKRSTKETGRCVVGKTAQRTRTGPGGSES